MKRRSLLSFLASLPVLAVPTLASEKREVNVGDLPTKEAVLLVERMRKFELVRAANQVDGDYFLFWFQRFPDEMRFEVHKTTKESILAGSLDAFHHNGKVTARMAEFQKLP